MSRLSLFLFIAWMIDRVILMHNVHKLTNKLMSKNYFDYKMSENVGAAQTPEVLPPEEFEYGSIDDVNSLGIL